MSIRKVRFIQNEYYHIYNRGNSKQLIFIDKEDYQRFTALLYACNQKGVVNKRNLTPGKTLYDIDRGNPLVAIGAYCLMPNHFHLLLTPIEDNGISAFIQKLGTAYCMYFNNKYDRSGSLFEGKFKSENTNTDRYLKYLFSYIHLNPIKLIDKEWKGVGIKNKIQTLDYLDKYTYSSYQDSLGIKRVENKIIDRKVFPDYFPDSKSFKTEIISWINYKR